jgi:hypothetical protein
MDAQYHTVEHIQQFIVNHTALAAAPESPRRAPNDECGDIILPRAHPCPRACCIETKDVTAPNVATIATIARILVARILVSVQY